jgi:hypothetical protein
MLRHVAATAPKGQHRNIRGGLHGPVTSQKSGVWQHVEYMILPSRRKDGGNRKLDATKLGPGRDLVRK